MTTPLTIDYLNDPGHGWYVLTPEHAAVLELTIDDFTTYSYHRDGTIYAEEDCDAAVVIAEHLKQFGVRPVITDVYTDEPAECRHYDSCTRQDNDRYLAAHAYLRDNEGAAA